MTPEDHKLAMAAIESLPNRSAYGKWLRRRLTSILAKRPGDFWDEFLARTNPPLPEAAALLRSGAVDESTTFSQLAGGILAELK